MLHTLANILPQTAVYGATLAALGAAAILWWLPPLPYRRPALFVALLAIPLLLWACGYWAAHHHWRALAQDLQAQVLAAQAEAQAASAKIETKVVTRTQVVQQRGRDVVEYITREVVKGDGSCTIPPEFVSAHNRAAEAPR